MSEATRAVALTEAVKFCTQGSGADPIAEATRFLAFLDSTPAAKPAATPAAKPAATPAAKPAATPAAKPAAVKPAAKPAAKPVAKTEDELVGGAADAAAEGPTEEDVGNAISDLLGADKRDEVVALLKEFGAKSKSTLKPEHYADFLDRAVALATPSDELTG